MVCLASRTTSLLWLLLSSQFVNCLDNVAVNTRQKRYLSFPNKAAFVLTVSLLKGVASEVDAGPTVKVVTIHELDVIFPLPHNPSVFELAQTALGQPPIFHQPHRQRRDLYQQLEEALYMQGHDGRACLLKSLCDSRTIPKTTEENVLQDLLTVIFSIPSLNETNELMADYHINEEKCSRYSKICSFSIFDMAFDWASTFSTLYNM